MVEEVAEWFIELSQDDPASADLVEDAIDRLQAAGPALGRSRYHNMKELRPGSTGSSELRIIFAFDPIRRAILLVAGNKANDWRRWYDKAITVADDRYDAHLAELDTRGYE
ncbi:type II toxin-antitoxin system RelE/ParE family toxin [Plantactinospora siamensis]|uniref:Type II toxin-antitoxin system RelE/ParE family toxin n=1 Tax=Plantactinospora siamensis TaxID=555372 RepID=A0ABV6NSQ2_9ACTN